MAPAITHSGHNVVAAYTPNFQWDVQTH